MTSKEFTPGQLEQFDFTAENRREGADRILISWIRTSLSLIGFGFGIAKYREILAGAGMIQTPPGQTNTTLIFGLSFIFLALLALLGAVIQHWRILQVIAGKKGGTTRFQPLAMIVAILLLGIGFFAVLAVLIR